MPSLNRNTGVYVIRNLVNGKVYVGSAKSLKNRKWLHWSELRGDKHHNIHLQRAWNKYGEHNFVFEVLERCSLVNCISVEQIWIDKYDSANPEHGYNISPTAGSPLGVVHGEETRKKVSDALKGKKKSAQHAANIRAGKKNISLQTKKLQSDYARNRTPEHLAKLSASAKKRIYPLGELKCAEETKRKIAEKIKLVWEQRREDGSIQEISRRIVAGQKAAKEESYAG